ncbi:PucR family transcriptional regulator [Brevibacterium gallinarum]|uniref:Helix-turn-helix domain-containing protein n=1 Tax=Brevibacterium gallinarum TaxID=2762220 RepID=A0ABR8WXY1_9MICO|nr:PucR family transcriptional regulator [Brevibacterium gallinarum]MBD8021870.1 helix-turn-helix domain-containing protein [Brevibacterium gallinarum]
MALTVPEAVDAFGGDGSILVQSRMRSPAAITEVLSAGDPLPEVQKSSGDPAPAGTRILLTASEAELAAAVASTGSAEALRSAGVRAVVICGSALARPEAADTETSSEEAGASLFTQLSQRDISVLGFTGGPDAAAARLYRAIADAAAVETERLAIMQQLLAAADADDPLASLVRVMARLCDGSAMVFDDSHALLHASGAGPVKLIASHLADSAHAAGEPFAVGRWNVAADLIRVRTHSYHLVLASHDSARLRTTSATVFDTLRSILGSFGAVEGFARTQQVVSSAALLRELELGISVGAEQRSWQRMAELGFTPYSELHFIICATAAGTVFTRSDLDAILAPAHLSSRVSDRGSGAALGMPMLAIESARLGDQDPGMRLLVPAGDAAEALITGLGQVPGRLVTGVSEPFSQLSALPEIARATETALRLARRNAAFANGSGAADREATPASGAVVRVDELSPLEWLLAGGTSLRDRSVLAGYAAELRTRPELFETLLSYLAANLTINRAAADLAIHPNTLRYRLNRIEELLGGSLSDPLVIANLCLAFHSELLGRASQMQTEAE